jgi:hypothetical protein
VGSRGANQVHQRRLRPSSGRRSPPSALPIRSRTSASTPGDSARGRRSARVEPISPRSIGASSSLGALKIWARPRRCVEAIPRAAALQDRQHPAHRHRRPG